MILFVLCVPFIFMLTGYLFRKYQQFQMKKDWYKEEVITKIKWFIACTLVIVVVIYLVGY